MGNRWVGSMLEAEIVVVVITNKNNYNDGDARTPHKTNGYLHSII